MSSLVWWVEQRETIRRKRLLGGPAPWTSDKILQRYRFCNIRRRDDRVSQWIIRHVVTPYSRCASLLRFLALCRWVNWPPTIQEIMHNGLWPMDSPDWEAIGRAIDARTRRGEKAWTGAFMVRGEQKSHGHPWARWGKGQYVAQIVVERELSQADDAITAALATNTRQAVALVLARGYGWGSFMAGQVVDDWTWTTYLQDATDHYTWAPLGPGSVRGLNRVMRRRLCEKIAQDEFVGELEKLRNAVIARLGGEYSDLTLMDIQNCLCEYDKYERVRLGEGRPRAHYRTEVAYE